jgi:hypothetical protein
LIKDLIIVRAGRGSLHPTWLDRRSPRNWDLFVCPYEEIPAAPIDENDWLSSNVLAGAKFTGLKLLLNEWHDWRDYRFVVLADDDLFATQATWSRFFEHCEHFGAQLAQPALAEGSHIAHVLLARNTEFVARRVSFVEVMMPCFRTQVLGQLLPSMDLSETGWGWGLDVLWAKTLTFKDLFVIDDTPVLHTRPVGGNYSPDLRDRVSAELATILRENGLVRTMKTLSGFLPDGREIVETDREFLYRLCRGYDHVFRQHPGRFHEVIHWQLANRTN